MLKLSIMVQAPLLVRPAAFGRLCVETADVVGSEFELCQPPSGGCVLKRSLTVDMSGLCQPAAFGRLCVETVMRRCEFKGVTPAAFGRLCVETRVAAGVRYAFTQPPSGGCVLKPFGGAACFFRLSPAAFGRLCVETIKIA